jgi:hypothetical protein
LDHGKNGFFEKVGLRLGWGPGDRTNGDKLRAFDLDVEPPDLQHGVGARNQTRRPSEKKLVDKSTVRRRVRD